jgi:hypothetical protein
VAACVHLTSLAVGAVFSCHTARSVPR